MHSDEGSLHDLGISECHFVGYCMCCAHADLMSMWPPYICWAKLYEQPELFVNHSRYEVCTYTRQLDI